MVRIIYHTPTLGYRVQDRATHRDILELEASFKVANIAVICIVDFTNRVVSNKSSDFSEHIDRIDPTLFDQRYIQL